MKSKFTSIGLITALSFTLAATFSINVNAISATALQQGIPSLAPMLKEVTPAVVSIRVSKTVQPTGQNYLNGQQIPDELKRFFNFQGEEFQGQLPLPGNEQRRQSIGSGSGVIIDAEAGFVVTNHHVIDGADAIVVTLNDNRSFEATLVGSDASTDVALLHVDADNLVALALADSDSAQIGDFVVAIGNPFDIGQTVTSGIVSAKGRAGLNNDHYEDFIQTDAAINVGNSGGALVDMEGKLVGINTAIISKDGSSAGIGFAVPANMVASVITHLKRDGEVKRGMLGVQISNLTPDVTDSLKLDISKGALVTNVVPDSAAEAAGIKVYDVIVEIDGNKVENSRDLRNYIGLIRQQDEVELKLYRDGEEMEVAAVIGDPRGVASTRTGAERPANQGEYAGAHLKTLEPGSNVAVNAGVEVVSVNPQSHAWQAGLRSGDVITEVNREAVSNLTEFNRKLEGLKGFTAVTVIREGRPMMIIMTS